MAEHDQGFAFTFWLFQFVVQPKLKKTSLLYWQYMFWEYLYFTWVAKNLSTFTFTLFPERIEYFYSKNIFNWEHSYKYQM